METLKTISIRKSIRSFKSEQIQDEDLEKVLKAGFAAPCGLAAYDSLHITVVQNQNFLDKLTKKAAEKFGQPELTPLFGAPTLIVVSSTDKVIPHVNAANVACIIENMSLAATDLGLGSLLLWGVFAALNEAPELIKDLTLPEGFSPQAGLAVGYPTEPLDSNFVNEHSFGVNYIK